MALVKEYMQGRLYLGLLHKYRHCYNGILVEDKRLSSTSIQKRQVGIYSPRSRAAVSGWKINKRKHQRYGEGWFWLNLSTGFLLKTGQSDQTSPKRMVEDEELIRYQE